MLKSCTWLLTKSASLYHSCNFKCESFNYFSSNRKNPVTKIGIRGRGEKLRIAATITISVVKQKGQLHILSGVVRSLVMILNPGGLKKTGKIHFTILIQELFFIGVARIGGFWDLKKMCLAKLLKLWQNKKSLRLLGLLMFFFTLEL